MIRLLGTFAILFFAHPTGVFAQSAQSGSRQHLLVQGNVQHVHYRLWMQAKANALGVSGWVRNRRDGSVEAVAMGSDNAVSALIEASHTGPANAKVSKIDQRSATDKEISQVDGRTARKNAGGQFVILKSK